MLRKILAYRFEIIAFLTGASVMVLEIVGARLIAPVFGASIYVWTAMIGVILGSLALGYAVGGKIADRPGSSNNYLGFILFAAAGLILAMAFIQEGVLGSIASHGLDLRISAFLAAVLLFGMPSVLLGMVSPYLAKRRVTSLETTGFTIGRLEAAGALGSIVGTFACGYFLLGAFGSRAIVLGVVAALLLTSLLASPRYMIKSKVAGLVLALAAGVILLSNPPRVLADVDSSYARYRVVRQNYNFQPINTLVTDAASIQSAAPADGSPELVVDYTQHFFEIAKAYGDPRHVLVVGGGTHTFPSALVRSDPDVRVDVAEIDPALDQLARDYFSLAQSPRLTIHHADGRRYLNTTQARYDLIYMDAFSSLSPPFHLATAETVARIADRLEPTGAAVVNVVGNYDDGANAYLRAVRATYATAFRYISIHQSITSLPLAYLRQNFVLIATNNKARFDSLVAQQRSPQLRLDSGGQVLADDYAPVERLTQ